MIPLVMSVIAKTETFQRDMAKAGASVNKFSTTTSRTTATMMKLGRSMMMMAGIGGGLYMLTRGIRGAIAAGLEQEKVERQLTAAIGGNISAMKRYAAEMQTQTIYGDELILSQMAYGKNLGINTEQLEAATTAAIGLAAKYRLELNSAMMLVGRAALGQTQMLTRYGIVLDETLGPQEKFNALLKIGADNFHLAQAETKSTAGAMAQFKNNVGDLGEEISMGVLPALTDMLTSVNENKDAWKEFFRVQISGWSEILSGLKSVRTVIEETNKRMVDKGLVPERQNYGMWAPMPQAKEITSEPGFTYPAGTPAGRLDISPKGYQAISEMNNRVLEMERAAAKEVEVAKSTGAAATEAADKRVQITARMYSDMGQMGNGFYQAQVALLDLQKADYSQHVGDKVLLERWYLNELNNIQEEIRVSSLNAMGLYYNELKADMADSAAYASEKFTEAAKSIEGSMSSAFQSMISEGASWKDAQRQFFAEVGNAYAKMLSDMAARALMAGMTNMIVGMFGGGGATGAGSAAGGSTRMHSGWVPDGVPRFRTGRGLKPNEMVAVIEKNELLAPNDQVVKSRSNLQGGGGINFQPKIIIVRDEREAQIEAMNSEAGEKVIIQKVMSYKGLLN